MTNRIIAYIIEKISKVSQTIVDNCYQDNNHRKLSMNKYMSQVIFWDYFLLDKSRNKYYNFTIYCKINNTIKGRDWFCE